MSQWVTLTGAILPPREVAAARPYGVIMNPRKRVFWIGLKKVLKVACRYIMNWETQLPETLPTAVKTAFPYIMAACAAIEAYDRAQPRGEGV